MDTVIVNVETGKEERRPLTEAEVRQREADATEGRRVVQEALQAREARLAAARNATTVQQLRALVVELIEGD